MANCKLPQSSIHDHPRESGSEVRALDLPAHAPRPDSALLTSRICLLPSSTWRAGLLSVGFLKRVIKFEIFLICVEGI